MDENSIAYWKMVQQTNQTWRVEQIYQDYGNVAVINLGGVIDKHMSDTDLDCYGGCDLADVDKALAIAANDDDIELVVLNVNSPGGSVLGVPETAARVQQLTQIKQVNAFVDGMACSAAYYIASQADQIDAAPSAILGSIGVYCAVLDQSKALEMKGYNVQLIKAGKYKAAGAFGPLSDDDKAMMQARVDSLHADFRGGGQWYPSAGIKRYHGRPDFRRQAKHQGGPGRQSHQRQPGRIRRQAAAVRDEDFQCHGKTRVEKVASPSVSLIAWH